MKKVFVLFLIFCSVICYAQRHIKLAKAQEIKILPLKKVYRINNETVYCRVQNLSTDTIHYRVGLEILKNKKLIGQVEDVFDLVPKKEMVALNFASLRPRKTVSVDCVEKRSLYGIANIIKNQSFQTYNYRFKLIYSETENNLNKIIYSKTFKILKQH